MVFAQQDTQLAKVQVVDGKQVFILNEPIREYIIVDSVRTGIKISSLLTRGLLNENINDKATQFTRRAHRKFSKEGLAFDAILYQDGKFAQAIRFTEPATVENNGVAEINSIDGVGTFIMAEPLEAYQVESVVRNRLNILPLLTHGFFNPSIARDMNRFVSSANKEHTPEFIAYSSGRKASIITFN